MPGHLFFCRLFLGALMLCCFALSCITPPFQSPDEFDHIKRSYLLTEGVIFLDAPAGKSSGGLVDSGLLEYMDNFQGLPFHPERKASLVAIEKSKKIGWSGVLKFSEAPGTGYYFPVIYAPQGLAIVIGRSAGLSVDTTYKLMRLIVLLAAGALLWVSFELFSPPPSLLLLLALPMGIFQMGSASLDPVATALIVLSISLFLRIFQNKGDENLGGILLLGGIIAILSTSRVHVAPLIGLLFFTSARGKRTPGMWVAVATSLLTVLWLYLAAKANVDMRVKVGPPTLTLLLHYLTTPSAFAAVLGATLAHEDMMIFLRQSFVGVLGWLDARFSDPLYSAFYAISLGMLAYAVSIADLLKGWAERSLLLVCALAMVAMTFLALLITWTPHPAEIVLGLQGRYFLAPAVLLTYVVALVPARRPAWMFGMNAWAIGSFLLFSFACTVNVLLVRYYLAG